VEHDAKMIIEKEHPLDNCQVFVQLRKCFHDYGQKAKSLKSLVYWSGKMELLGFIPGIIHFALCV